MPTAPARRSQASRRTETRDAILEATIQSLVEVGYARATTTEIATRAGVSQGSIFKHFPTKARLVSAAAERLFATLMARFGDAFEGNDSAVHPIVAAMRRLWDIFCDPSLRAMYLLFAEAPADDELRASLRPVVERHEAAIVQRATTLFPELLEQPALAALFDGVLFAMQGLALQRPIFVDPDRERAMLRHFETMAVQLFPARRKRAERATKSAKSTKKGPPK